MTPPRPWTLGAVLAEQRVDDRTHLLVARPDAPVAAAHELERRLVAERLAGKTTLIVSLVAADYVSGAMITSLVRAERRIGVRNGRLVVTSESADVRNALQCAGLEMVDLDSVVPGRRVAS